MIKSQYKVSEINTNQLIRDERLMAVYVTYETGVV